jgi:hypothetical protein
VIGQAGFLDPSKQSEILFQAQEDLQRILPGVRIVAVRIGGVRSECQVAYVEELRRQRDNKNRFLVEIHLPQRILPLAQRAFDINFYWPRDCTQSGALAHALGAGATIAGRDLEGVGEILKDAGQLVDDNFDRLLYKIKDVILSQEMIERMEENALKYAADYTWDKQAVRHSEIVDMVLSKRCFEAASDFGISQEPAYTSMFDISINSDRSNRVAGTVSVVA